MPFASHNSSIPRLSTAGIAASILMCLFACIACAKLQKQTTGPGMFAPQIGKATLAAYKAGGWVPLQEPDSRFAPGTIFRAAPGQMPQWVSSLESCGVPKSVLSVAVNHTGLFKSTSRSEYSASAVLNLPGVAAGPDFAKARMATFEQADAGASAIDIIRVGEWIRKNPSGFAPGCREYLSKPSMFVAQESYRVGSGAYTLQDAKGANLTLSGLASKVLNLNASVKVTGDTSITTTVPMYTAVHRAVYANDVLELFEAPSRGVLNYADADINRSLLF